MISWEYSRNQLCHHGFVIVKPKDDYAIEVDIHIRPTNRGSSVWGKVRIKDGYDLFEGRMGVEDVLIKHAKTVKLLKEFAEEHYK
jgi:hypothetical protein